MSGLAKNNERMKTRHRYELLNFFEKVLLTKYNEVDRGELKRMLNLGPLQNLTSDNCWCKLMEIWVEVGGHPETLKVNEQARIYYFINDTEFVPLVEWAK
jgi:hypothetical protein